MEHTRKILVVILCVAASGCSHPTWHVSTHSPATTAAPSEPKKANARLSSIPRARTPINLSQYLVDSAVDADWNARANGRCVAYTRQKPIR